MALICCQRPASISFAFRLAFHFAFWRSQILLWGPVQNSSRRLLSVGILYKILILSAIQELTNQIRNPKTPSITSIVKLTIHPLSSKTYQKALGHDFLWTRPILKYFMKHQSHTTSPWNRTDTNKFWCTAKMKTYRIEEEKTTRKSAQENMSPLKNIQNDKIKEVIRKGRRRKRKITWSNPPLYVFPTRKQILQNKQ